MEHGEGQRKFFTYADARGSLAVAAAKAFASEVAVDAGSAQSALASAADER